MRTPKLNIAQLFVCALLFSIADTQAQTTVESLDGEIVSEQQTPQSHRRYIEVQCGAGQYYSYYELGGRELNLWRDDTRGERYLRLGEQGQFYTQIAADSQITLFAAGLLRESPSGELFVCNLSVYSTNSRTRTQDSYSMATPGLTCSIAMNYDQTFSVAYSGTSASQGGYQASCDFTLRKQIVLKHSK